MDNVNKILISLSWSGGKDSAFALFHLLQDTRYEVRRLHTTLGEQTQRVGMHGTAEKLVEMQAEAIGLPLDKIYFPASGDNHAYETAINSYLDQLLAEGIQHLAYGDIYLKDLRKYREDQLASRGFLAVFPLWNIPTYQLARDFVEAGFKSLICAADADLIAKAWLGRDFSPAFLESLPADVDPCGENGEFHSFCYAGPIFNHPLSIVCQKIVGQNYDITLASGEKRAKKFWFAELLQAPQIE